MRRYKSTAGGYQRVEAEEDPLDELRTYFEDTWGLAHDLRPIADATLARGATRAAWPLFGRRLRRVLEKNHIQPSPGGRLEALIMKLERG